MNIRDGTVKRRRNLISKRDERGTSEIDSLECGLSSPDRGAGQMYKFVAFAAAFLSFAASMAAAQPPIPPPGLYCCPLYGPDALPLNRQQINPYNIFCYYDDGTDEACFYNPATGAGGGPAAGCPPEAIPNPHPPTCPV
ncbi:hypothetical protein LshimejAT787_0311980 [Lyophyllum shimeji]|uniref:Uncharacterized protein n=1 Tax=Lyophyllum shimeji TaxID=47721 RepID=A0A9P3UN25_LYOSH|nr:hypothetical protein LshimejAT787_0311980 [Lyophyllum shimeji]